MRFSQLARITLGFSLGATVCLAQSSEPGLKAPASAPAAKPAKNLYQELESALFSVSPPPTNFPDAQTFIYRDLKPEPLRLFVVKPADWRPNDHHPAFLYFFGGGWTRGDPNKSIGWARMAAKWGMIGIAPDYRTAGRFGTTPVEAVADARAAMRWIEDHATELGVDINKIVVGGVSAGGHLALWTAIEKAPFGSLPEESPATKPAALVLISAPGDTTPAVINGFTGSSIWHALYAFPPTSQAFLERGYVDFAQRWLPILDVFAAENVNFALEVHPTEIAFDIASARRALAAVGNHPRFGFNYDPSHLGYQGVDYVKFLRDFPDRIFHAHMKDVWWGHGDGSVGVFGGHTDFTDARRYWDFRSLGHGDINFEEIIVALNDIGYRGPLSVEWEDGRMDRVHGATESCAFVRQIDFTPNAAAFDAAFAKKH